MDQLVSDLTFVHPVSGKLVKCSTYCSSEEDWTTELCETFCKTTKDIATYASSTTCTAAVNTKSADLVSTTEHSVEDSTQLLKILLLVFFVGVLIIVVLRIILKSTGCFNGICEKAADDTSELNQLKVVTSNTAGIDTHETETGPGLGESAMQLLTHGTR